MKIRKNNKGLTFRKKSKKSLYVFYSVCLFAVIVSLFVIIGTNDETAVQNDITADNAVEDFSENIVEADTEITTEDSASGSAVRVSETKANDKYTKMIEEKVNLKLSQMSNEEKVAQLFVITVEQLTGYSSVSSAGNVTRSSMEQYPVGGVILFDNNIVSPNQVKEFNANLQAYSQEISGLPLFIGVDEEGGDVTRIAKKSAFNAARFEKMSEIGLSGDISKAREVGETIGAYLKEYGFNLDFAPVADVLTNSDNKVVAGRSFGSDADAVSAMVNEVAAGLSENGVFPCLKHFPGHGGTEGDTHEGYAYTNRNIVQITESELVPFKNGINNGIDFIMVAHISAPNVTGDKTPATLSSYMVNDILRKQMGFDGIVITDAMNMGAITSQYNSGDAAVKAIQAGVDIVLMPADFKSAYSGVLNAVNDGDISDERLDDSVARILRIKYSMEDISAEGSQE